MSFEALLEEFDSMQKSLAAQAEEAKQDDEKIQSAAEGDGDDDEDDEKGAAGAGEKAEGEEKEEEGEAVMGKSFSFTLDSGEVVEAVDGTELVKSLMGRIENNESQVATALTGALGLIKQQGEMIKSLNDKVIALGAEGRGRKASLTIHEKPAVGSMEKSEPSGMPAGEFLTKCLAAQAAGRITGQDVSRAQIALNSGVAVPSDIVSRVAG